jgi:hypothetical protein
MTKKTNGFFGGVTAVYEEIYRNNQGPLPPELLVAASSKRPQWYPDAALEARSRTPRLTKMTS